MCVDEGSIGEAIVLQIRDCSLPAEYNDIDGGSRRRENRFRPVQPRSLAQPSPIPPADCGEDLINVPEPGSRLVGRAGDRGETNGGKSGQSRRNPHRVYPQRTAAGRESGREGIALFTLRVYSPSAHSLSPSATRARSHTTNAPPLARHKRQRRHTVRLARASRTGGRRRGFCQHAQEGV